MNQLTTTDLRTNAGYAARQSSRADAADAADSKEPAAKDLSSQVIRRTLPLCSHYKSYQPNPQGENAKRISPAQEAQ